MSVDGNYASCQPLLASRRIGIGARLEVFEVVRVVEIDHHGLGARHQIRPLAQHSCRDNEDVGPSGQLSSPGGSGQIRHLEVRMGASRRNRAGGDHVEVGREH